MLLVFTLENLSFRSGSYTNEVMRTAEEYLESLRGKVWLIPKNFVEVQFFHTLQNPR